MRLDCMTAVWQLLRTAPNDEQTNKCQLMFNKALAMVFALLFSCCKNCARTTCDFPIDHGYVLKCACFPSIGMN